ncbi:twin-arginine translocation signal domain-containing protein [Micromonospora sicca]|uniref:Twin-arginine translocation signal domain-containing protein n=1 Tax=Micromonospora sicca TaxID=2202420 RepID=A0A317DNB8_9ACTN|nr:hypothetical protein DKT69_16750 [Micromonospora sp. 4G51]
MNYSPRGGELVRKELSRRDVLRLGGGVVAAAGLPIAQPQQPTRRRPTPRR